MRQSPFSQVAPYPLGVYNAPNAIAAYTACEYE